MRPGRGARRSRVERQRVDTGRRRFAVLVTVALLVRLVRRPVRGPVERAPSDPRRYAEAAVRRLGDARRSRVRARGRWRGARFGARNANGDRRSRHRRRDGGRACAGLVPRAAADPAERQRGLGACRGARRRARAHADRRRPLRTTAVAHRGGRRVLRAPVGVGAPATPTRTGRFYVDQRLVPTILGPSGSLRSAISAFSPVLTWWPQGGQIATTAPTSRPSGQARTNGCIRFATRPPRACVRDGRCRDAGRVDAVGRVATAFDR